MRVIVQEFQRLTQLFLFSPALRTPSAPSVTTLFESPTPSWTETRLGRCSFTVLPPVLLKAGPANTCSQVNKTTKRTYLFNFSSFYYLSVWHPQMHTFKSQILCWSCKWSGFSFTSSNIIAMHNSRHNETNDTFVSHIRNLLNLSWNYLYHVDFCLTVTHSPCFVYIVDCTNDRCVHNVTQLLTLGEHKHAVMLHRGALLLGLLEV